MTVTKKTALLSVCCLLAVLILVPTTYGGLTAYEGFDGAAAMRNLDGFSGGSATGVTGSWQVTGNNPTAVDVIVRDYGTTFAAFPYPVPFDVTQNGSNYHWAALNTYNNQWWGVNPATRGLSSPIDLGADAVYYYSFLARVHGNDTQMMVGLSDGTNNLASGMNYYSGSTDFAVHYGTANPSTDGTPDRAYATVNNGAGYFVVTEIKTSAVGIDTVCMKAYQVGIDTVSNSPSEVVWDVTKEFSGSAQLDRIYASFDGPANGYPNFDEFRIGTEWIDVTGLPADPDPEPFGPGAIGINFTGRLIGNSIPNALQVESGASADSQAGVPGTTTPWNDVPTPGTSSGTGITVVGVNGEQARVDWMATGTWSHTANGTRIVPNEDPDGDMMDGHIEATHGAATVTVSGLANNYSSYDVYIYVGDDAGNRQGELRFNDGPVQNFTSKLFNGTFVEGEDYFVFRDVTVDSFTVSVECVDGLYANRTGLRGIEIIGVPEPSALLSAGIGLLALVGRCRRR